MTPSVLRSLSQHQARTFKVMCYARARSPICVHFTDGQTLDHALCKTIIFILLHKQHSSHGKENPFLKLIIYLGNLYYCTGY
jgi:hypothetical protein